MQETLCQTVGLGELRIVFDDTIAAIAKARAEDEALTQHGEGHVYQVRGEEFELFIFWI